MIVKNNAMEIVDTKIFSKKRCTAGRCEVVPKTILQEQYRNNIRRHNQNYTGISKKMAYGRYARTTPGLETFSSKKVTSLQPKVQEKQECFISYWCPQR